MKNTLHFTFLRALIILAFGLFFNGSWGQGILPLSRTVWNSVPAGWSDNAGGNYLTSFACSGNNGGKFDSNNQNYTVNFDSSPDKLSFEFKSNSTNSSSTVLVQESSTGVANSYTNVISLTGSQIGTTCSTKGPYQLNANSRFVKISFTKGTSNGTIDDVVITKGVSASPNLSLSSNNLVGVSYISGNGPSQSSSINIDGTNLAGAPGVVAVNAASTDYEVSLDNSTFAGSVNIPYTTATLSAPLYIRLKAGLTVNSYDAQVISITGGNATASLTVSGSVTLPFALPYSNDLRSQEKYDEALSLGFLGQDIIVTSGYLRIPLDGSLETPTINFASINNITVSFSTSTFGGSTNQALTVLISNDNGNTYQTVETYLVPGNYATTTRSIDLTNLNNNGKIKFQMTGGTNSTRFRDLQIFVTPTTWNGSTWSNGIPTATVDAIIDGDFTTSSTGFAANSLTVNNTKTFTVASGSTATITNGITNNAVAANFVVESGANLIQTNNVANTTPITVLRNSALLVRLDHTLWSSPVSAQKLFAFSPNTLINRFFTYQASTSAYLNSGLTSDTDFDAAKGYAIRAANNHPTTATIWNGKFIGVPNNGPASIAVDATGQGFNLIGNPYPSPISATSFLAGNTGISGTLYFYAHTLSMDSSGVFPAGSNYALYNATGSTSATPGTSGVPALTPNGIIQVGQGFFVKAATSGTVNFSNTMRVADTNNQFLRNGNVANSEVEKHRIWLNLKNDAGTEFNQILLGYVDGATQGIDRNFDGLSFGNVGSAISSRIENADYTIQGRALPFNTSDVVSLGFKAVTAGNYTISISETDGLFAGEQNVYLKDTSNGSITNLKAGNYSFSSAIGAFNNRFEIVYNSTLGTPDSTFNSNSIVAFKSNNELNVQTKSVTMKSILVFDIQGRLLAEQSVNGDNAVISNLSADNQVLLVQVTSENNEKVTIKVIF